MSYEEPKPSTYTFKPAEDDGFWTVEGLNNPTLGRDVTVMKGADQNFKELLEDIFQNYRRLIRDADIFVTPEGQFKFDGGMLIPYEPPTPAPADTATPSGGATPATPGQPAPPLPAVPVGVSAIDSQGSQFSGTLTLPWPKVTNSEIVVEWDKVSTALTPGNLITSIRVPGTDQRILEIGYNDDQTRVVIHVG